MSVISEGLKRRMGSPLQSPVPGWTYIMRGPTSYQPLRKPPLARATK
jgi:hypothetical protein